MKFPKFPDEKPRSFSSIRAPKKGSARLHASRELIDLSVAGTLCIHTEIRQVLLNTWVWVKIRDPKIMDG